MSFEKIKKGKREKRTPLPPQLSVTQLEKMQKQMEQYSDKLQPTLYWLRDWGAIKFKDPYNIKVVVQVNDRHEMSTYRADSFFSYVDQYNNWLGKKKYAERKELQRLDAVI